MSNTATALDASGVGSRLTARYTPGSGQVSVRSGDGSIWSSASFPGYFTLINLDTEPATPSGAQPLQTVYSCSGVTAGNGSDVLTGVTVASGRDQSFPTGSLCLLCDSTGGSLPTTGLTLTQFSSPITTDTDGATVTFNLATSNWHQVTLGGNRTLALSNPTIGQQFTIILIQDGTGSRTVTWFSTIKWPSATPPTLTTTAGGIDVFTFKCVGTNSYYGFVPGQAMG